MSNTCWALVKSKLIIIGSYLTVGAQGSAACLGAFGKMSGIDCRRFLIPSLASPPPSATYCSHFLPVSFPLRKFLETPATQAIIDGKHLVKVLFEEKPMETFQNSKIPKFKSGLLGLLLNTKQ